MKHFLYWFFNLTWGAIESIPGLLIAIFLLITGHKPTKNGYGFIFEIGGNWGGLSLGPVAFCGRYNQPDSGCYDPDWYNHTRKHEFGHSLQLCIFGPIHLFIVAIPSIIRYWVFRYNTKHEKSNPDYDAVWFEGTATRWGTKWVEKIENDHYGI